MSSDNDHERDRDQIRSTLSALTPPPGADDVVLTRWVTISEYISADGMRFTRVESGDHDELPLAVWDEMGLIGYALEKAKQNAWETDGGYEQAFGEDDEADG